MKRLMVLVAIGVILGPVPRAALAQSSDPDRFLVSPFDNPRHEARIYWLAEASAILLADNLKADGRLAYTREERREAFEQLQVPAVASLSHATVIRLGQLIGATHVVIGSITLDGTRVSVRAQDIRLDTGRMEKEVAETGPLEELFVMFERLAARLLGVTSGLQSRASADSTLQRPSLQVFENYVKGLLATTPSTKVGYLQAALKLDPTFDRARLALWAAHQDNGNAQAALAAAAAVPETSSLYTRARFASALSLIQLKRLDDAFATLKALADRVPAATLMNNLGVIQLRRPATPETGKATYYFNQAVKLDADDPDYAFNLGYAYWLEHDEQGAIYWLREAVRRKPADGQAHAVLAAALQSLGSPAEAGRERELAAQLSARPVDASTRGLERLKPALDVILQPTRMAMAETGQRDQRELAAFHLERGRRLFEQGNDADATAELRRALYSSPYEAEAHLLLGQIYLRLGQTHAAIDAFKISLWSSDSAAGHIALARAYVQAQDTAGARAEAQKALSLAPGSAEARALLETVKP
jgi:Tfp pilus assembly protein PilF